jgi:hypothetical protein
VLFGLLLSLLYQHHGLWTAVAFHWIWNIFSDHLVKAMFIEGAPELPDFEGAFTTCVVLAALVLALALELELELTHRLRKRREVESFGS